MLTTILLIRHGQTDWNIAGRWQGQTDIPLNATGLTQAHSLAQRLSSWPISAIYSSDLSRALSTAAILGDYHQLTPRPDKALRERHGGRFQGLTRQEMAEQFGDIWLRVRKNGSAPPGGESLLDVARRVTTSFESIVQEHRDQMVAIVSHGGAMNLLIAHVLGFPLGKPAPISLRGNTGLSIVEITSDGRRLTLLNDTSHLDDEGGPVDKSRSQ